MNQINELQNQIDMQYENQVRRELKNAREKFPGTFGAFVALIEEVGEVAKAILQEDYRSVERELKQVSTMAHRVATEGDGHISQLRRHLQLDDRLDASRILPHIIPDEPEFAAKDSRPTKRAIYISGPMSGIPEHNFPAFLRIEEEILESFAANGIENFSIVNPARLDSPDDPEMEWADYLRRDIRVLMDCDSIFLLPGWQLSKGANLERAIARALGFRVFQAGVDPETEIARLSLWILRNTVRENPSNG